MANDQPTDSTLNQGAAKELPRATLLSDKPTDEDKFEGKGHHRSAAALAEAVDQLAHKDGAIGLEGRWGSGKSSVINLAEKELDELNRKKRRDEHIHHHLMCYDLWAHQSDIFRRSFLEELLQWCGSRSQEEGTGSKPLLSGEEIEDFRDKIRDRVKKVTYKVDRGFSLLGVIFVLLAPLLPVMVAWLSPIAFSDAVNPETTHLWFQARWGFPAAAILTFAIYMALGIRILFARYGGSKEDKKKEKRTWARAFASTASVFRNEVEDRTETQNIRDEDPSSLEFQRQFRSILEKAQGQKHRIVFVFDNIDRLPADLIFDTWADIRSVFAVPAPEGDDPKSSVTAIVPYDRDLVGKATAGTANITFVKSPDGMLDAESSHENGKVTSAAELIAKTFDITIRVAPPVSTDWEKFFYSKLSEAFGGEEESGAVITHSNRYRVFKLFDEQKKNAGSYPTPRQIISYINSIGSLWNQWRGKLPIESLALYAIFREAIEESPTSITNERAIPPAYVRIAAQEAWQSHLAALVFNVDVEKAGQVLLGPRIRTALEDEDVNELREISENSIFKNALVDEISSRAGAWARDRAQTFASVISSLHALERNSEESNLCWRILGQALGDLRQAELNEFDDYTNIAKLVSAPTGISPIHSARKLVNWSVNVPLPEDQRTREQGEAWFNFFEAIARELEKSRSSEQLRSFISRTRYPSGEQFALGVALACAQSDLMEFTDFDGTFDQAKLDKAIVDLALSQPHLVETIARKDKPALSNSGMESAASKVSDELRGKQGLAIGLAESYATLLLILHDKQSSVDGHIARLSDDGTLAWYRNEAEKAEEVEVAALFHFLMTLVRSEEETKSHRPNPHSQLGDLAEAWAALDKAYGPDHNQPGYEDAIAGYVTERGSLTSWIEKCLPERDWRFHTRVVLAAIRSHELGNLNTGKVLSYYPNLADIFSAEDTQNLLKKLGGYNQHFGKHYNGASLLDFPARILEDASDFGLSNYGQISKDIQSHLSSLAKDDWVELLKSNENALRLLNHEIATNGYSVPVAEYRPAVLELMQDVATGSFSVQLKAELYDPLPLAVANSAKSRVKNDFVLSLDKLVVTAEGVRSFVDTFDEFSQSLELEQHPDITLEKIVLPLIESRSDSEEAYLENKKSELSRTYSKAAKETKQQIKDAVHDIYETGNDGEKAWAEDLRIAFSLPAFPKKESAPSTDETGSTEEGTE